MSKPEAPNKTNNRATTGHEWDGIQEYNNPLPRWWVWVFLLCIIFSIGYVFYYPAIPGGGSTTSGWTSLGQLDSNIAKAREAQGPLDARIEASTPDQIEADADLRTYATAAGKALFANTCSQCHGASGAGAKGYPNLQDDEWLYGGSLSAIMTTITHGIRSKDDAETRDPGPMPAWNGVITPEQVSDVVNYLSVLSAKLPGNESTQRGAAVFAENCAVCHGDQGQGNRELGAPPLNNAIWLYGSDRETRLTSVNNGRAGVMPAWGAKLSASDIKKLAVYVHGLGGGEAEVMAEPALPATETSPTETSPTEAASPTSAK